MMERGILLGRKSETPGDRRWLMGSFNPIGVCE